MVRHNRSMHSIPPEVTINSSSAGATPCVAATRSRRYSRVDARPALGPYCSATPGSVAITLAAISPSTSVWNVATFGNPPVIASTPGVGPERIAASSAPPRLRARSAKRDVQSIRHIVPALLTPRQDQFTPRSDGNRHEARRSCNGKEEADHLASLGLRAVPSSSTPAGPSTCRAAAPDQRGGPLLRNGASTSGNALRACPSIGRHDAGGSSVRHGTSEREIERDPRLR